jgi:hypothetical protein
MTDEKAKKVLVWLNDSVTAIGLFKIGWSKPLSIFVTMNGDAFIGNGGSIGRIRKPSPDALTGSFNAPMSFASSCYGLFVDINDNLYCSLFDNHQVMKRSLYGEVTTATIAAGSDSEGSDSKSLSNPYGIFVDDNFDLYVADSANNRIQLFRSGQSDGITVAGITSLNITIGLGYPTGVVLDADKYLFIVDREGSRIIGSGPNGFRCVAGCSIQGSSSDQLSIPTSLSFDSFGNIFVADTGNSRIQKFLLFTNSYGKHIGI